MDANGTSDERPFVAPCRRLDATAPLRWLRLGWADLRAAPGPTAVFGLADRTDPAYALACREAAAAGVEVVCYACTVSQRAIRLVRPLPVDLETPEE